MRIGQIILIAAIATAFLQFSPSSQAQITRSLDGNGRVVFVNTDLRPSHKTVSAIPKEAPSAGSTSDTFGSPENAGSATGAAEGGKKSVLDAIKAQVTTLEETDREGRLDRIVQTAAARHKVDPALVKAVIATESNWNPSAISNKGAVGLMQLIPGTAERFGVSNSFDPEQNVEGGTTYLRSLLDRYNGDLPKTLAAYNAGERAVDLNHGVPAYRETQDYVHKVTNAYFRPGSGRDATLWSPPRAPVRREINAAGDVVFTNE